MTTQDAGSYYCNATIMSNNMVFIRTPQQTRDIQVFSKYFAAMHVNLSYCNIQRFKILRIEWQFPWEVPHEK